ncbi:MAG: hypothetical protein RLZZ175_2361 [Bacteroidota bacterium]|jgi:hypothetical protein
MKIKLLLPLLILFYQIVFAQAPPKVEFRILASKGKNLVNHKHYSTGHKLYPSDQITITQGGYIGLVHKSGKTFEFREVGSFAVSDIAAKLEESNHNRPTRFSDFVTNEFTKDSHIKIDKSKFNKKAAEETDLHKKEKIDLLLPDSKVIQTVEVLYDTLIISWKKHEANTNIHVASLINYKNEVAFTAETSDTSIALICDEKMFLQGETFTLEIIIKDKPDKKLVQRKFMIVPHDKFSILHEEVIDLNHNIPEDNALNNYLKAEFYAKNGLFFEALNHFQKAVILEKDVPDYVIGFNNYLASFGLNNFIVETKKH